MGFYGILVYCLISGEAAILFVAILAPFLLQNYSIRSRLKAASILFYRGAGLTFFVAPDSQESFSIGQNGFLLLVLGCWAYCVRCLDFSEQPLTLNVSDWILLSVFAISLYFSSGSVLLAGIILTVVSPFLFLPFVPFALFAYWILSFWDRHTEKNIDRNYEQHRRLLTAMFGLAFSLYATFAFRLLNLFINQ